MSCAGAPKQDAPTKAAMSEASPLSLFEVVYNPAPGLSNAELLLIQNGERCRPGQTLKLR
jgi:hypothetical protein